MKTIIPVSPEIKEATEHNPDVSDIIEIYKAIDQKKIEIDKTNEELLDLEVELYKRKKQRKPITIQWRSSIITCLTVDKKNPRYFLKTTAGVCTCVAYINQIEIEANMRNKIAITLANLHKQEKIGRIKRDDGYYYGLPEFFNDDMVTLKQEYIEHEKELIKQ